MDTTQMWPWGKVDDKDTQRANRGETFSHGRGLGWWEVDAQSSEPGKRRKEWSGGRESKQKMKRKLNRDTQRSRFHFSSMWFFRSDSEAQILGDRKWKWLLVHPPGLSSCPAGLQLKIFLGSSFFLIYSWSLKQYIKKYGEKLVVLSDQQSKIQIYSIYKERKAGNAQIWEVGTGKYLAFFH